MKILILVDKYKSAIDRLSQPIKEHNPHLDIEILPLHPKRPDLEQIEAVTKAYKECDILHVAYWKSGEKLKEFIDISDKPKLMCHYNAYDHLITKKKAGEGLSKNMLWNQDNTPSWVDMYDELVVGNETLHNDLPYAHLIPYTIDLNFWQYNTEYKEDGNVLMVVARIESSKGVLETAKVTKKLGLPFVLVGRISDGNYFQEVKKANPEMIFKEDITDEELREEYRNAAIHVCNSKDNFESGTLPILESMAMGVPVLTRNIGHVPDLYNGQNMVVRMEEKENLEDLEKELSELMLNTALRDKIRDKAWDTVKNRPNEKYAIEFEKLYYKLLTDKYNEKHNIDNKFVSVITPTCDRPETLVQNLAHTLKQNYPLFELIVVDNGDQSIESLVEEARKHTTVPIKYIRFDRNGEYALAKARNLGVMAATGQLLVFCDERMGMRQGALQEFVNRWQKKSWNWGIKDDYKKGFVENFSCISRHDLVRFGMFNERINIYGGMTQELRTRFEQEHRFTMEILLQANADTISRAKSKNSKRDSIRRAKHIIYKIYNK
jgi:glycosyltransferase involved in cell wall biosynthesis